MMSWQNLSFTVIQNNSYALNFRIWEPPAFRTHEIFVQTLTAANSLTCFDFLLHMIFCTEAAAYEMFEYKMHTKYSGFTVVHCGLSWSGDIND